MLQVESRFDTYFNAAAAIIGAVVGSLSTLAGAAFAQKRTMRREATSAFVLFKMEIKQSKDVRRTLRSLREFMLNRIDLLAIPSNKEFFEKWLVLRDRLDDDSKPFDDGELQNIKEQAQSLSVSASAIVDGRSIELGRLNTPIHRVHKAVSLRRTALLRRPIAATMRHKDV